MAWERGSLLTVDDLDAESFSRLFETADYLKPLANSAPVKDYQGVRKRFENRRLCEIFFNSSTRTVESFKAAMQRLGGHAEEFIFDRSSMGKGESVEDTLKMLKHCYDIFVIRDKEPGNVMKYADVLSPKPVINAGDSENHPVQAIVDLYYIGEKNLRQGAAFALVRDLSARVTTSLIKGIRKFGDKSKFYGFPFHPELGLPKELWGNDYTENAETDESLSTALQWCMPKYVYLSRDQVEYHGKSSPAVITAEHINVTQAEWMHALPVKKGEMTEEAKNHPRFVAYRRQSEGRVPASMAIVAGGLYGIDAELR